MILYALMWIAAGTAIGLTMLWFQHGNGRKKLRKWRGAAFGRSVKVVRETWHHHHYQRTPRARLRAQRKQEPLRWTVGHRRRPDDPTLVRRVARAGGQKAKDAGSRGVERAKVSWMNRRTIADRLESRNTYRDMGPQMMCGSTKTENGHPCRNPRMIGKDHCQVHPKFSLGIGRRDEDGMTAWERKRLLREQEREQRREQERWAEQQRRERESQDREQGAEGNGHRESGGWGFERREEQPQEQPSSNGDGSPVMEPSHSGGSDSGGSSE